MSGVCGIFLFLGIVLMIEIFVGLDIFFGLFFCGSGGELGGLVLMYLVFLICVWIIFGEVDILGILLFLKWLDVLCKIVDVCDVLLLCCELDCRGGKLSLLFRLGYVEFLFRVGFLMNVWLLGFVLIVVIVMIGKDGVRDGVEELLVVLFRFEIGWWVFILLVLCIVDGVLFLSWWGCFGLVSFLIEIWVMLFVEFVVVVWCVLLIVIFFFLKGFFWFLVCFLLFFWILLLIFWFVIVLVFWEVLFCIVVVVVVCFYFVFCICFL